MVDQSYYKKADEIIEHYERCAASLIPIMQDIQAEYRYLPAELLTYVAGQIGVTEARPSVLQPFMRTFLLNLKENTLSRYAMHSLSCKKVNPG